MGPNLIVLCPYQRQDRQRKDSNVTTEAEIGVTSAREEYQGLLKTTRS